MKEVAMSTQLPGMEYQVDVPVAGLYRDPSGDDLETEALYGELVTVQAFKPGWAQVVTQLDAYPGYLKLACLKEGKGETPTHRVAELSAAVYSQPDFKKRMVSTLFFNSLVHVAAEMRTPEGVMCEIPGLGWVFGRRLKPIEYAAPDFVEECCRLGNRDTGVEYGWGQRSSRFDCSAAIQAACIAAGIPCPRDCIPQSQALGEQVSYAPDFSDLRRGDLVFWTEKKGRHVAVMVGNDECFNVTIAEPWGRALVQPLLEVIEAQERDGNGRPTLVRRFAGYHSSS